MGDSTSRRTKCKPCDGESLASAQSKVAASQTTAMAFSNDCRGKHSRQLGPLRKYATNSKITVSASKPPRSPTVARNGMTRSNRPAQVTAARCSKGTMRGDWCNPVSGGKVNPNPGGMCGWGAGGSGQWVLRGIHFNSCGFGSMNGIISPAARRSRAHPRAHRLKACRSTANIG